MGAWAIPLLLMLVRSQTAHAAQPQMPSANMIDLSGPRVGMTFLDHGVRNTIRGYGSHDVGPIVSQFGWQKEKQFLSSPNGIAGVTEWVLLVGGLEKGLFLPSASWLVGARTTNGIEFAVGPNLSATGFGLAAAAGITFRTGSLNVPINFAAVRSQSGVRVSLLAGFNVRKP